MAPGSSSGGDSFIQAGVGAVTRTIGDGVWDVFSVKDFGAIGDGNANDGNAINAVTLPPSTLKGRSGIFRWRDRYKTDGVRLMVDVSLSRRDFVVALSCAALCAAVRYFNRQRIRSKIQWAGV